MLKRVSNKDLLSLVKSGKAEYDSGEAKKVFDPEEAHSQIMRTLEIVATKLAQDNNEEVVNLYNSIQASIDNLYNGMMGRMAQLLAEMEKDKTTVILERIDSMQKEPKSEEWEFDANRDSTGKIIFPIKARKI